MTVICLGEECAWRGYPITQVDVEIDDPEEFATRLFDLNELLPETPICPWCHCEALAVEGERLGYPFLYN
jgi:hypothetical protein